MQRIPPLKPRLEVRDLELVLAVASAGSTARAAGTLHLTQSAVSRGLLAAESKLGVRLFERTVRGLAPTTAGERLIGGASAVLAQLIELEAQTGAPRLTPKPIRLVCECYTAYRWLPSTLARLKPHMPNLSVSLAVEHTQAPVPALLAEQIDVALLTTAPVRGDLEERTLFSDEVVFVVGATHPLATKPSFTLRDLRETPLIGSSNTAPGEVQWWKKKVFGQQRPKLEFLRFPLTEAIVDAARAGMGIAVLSEWIASSYLDREDELVAKRLSSGPIRRPWRIAYRQDFADAAEHLAAMLKSSRPRLYPA